MILASERNALRLAVVDCGIDKEVSKARFVAFSNGDRRPLEALEADYGADVVKAAKAFLDSLYRKKKKCVSKVGGVIKSGNAYFVTLTFSDKALNRSTPKTRRRAVSRFLKSISAHYVANVDYGAQNGREHYHAVCDDVNITDLTKHFWEKRYGFLKFEKVGFAADDVEAVCKYITKLSRHALKETAGKGVRLIYSRFSLQGNFMGSLPF